MRTGLGRHEREDVTLLDLEADRRAADLDPAERQLALRLAPPPVERDLAGRRCRSDRPQASRGARRRRRPGCWPSTGTVREISIHPQSRCRRPAGSQRRPGPSGHRHPGQLPCPDQISSTSVPWQSGSIGNAGQCPSTRRPGAGSGPPARPSPRTWRRRSATPRRSSPPGPSPAGQRSPRLKPAEAQGGSCFSGRRAARPGATDVGGGSKAWHTFGSRRGGRRFHSPWAIPGPLRRAGRPPKKPEIAPDYCEAGRMPAGILLLGY